MEKEAAYSNIMQYLTYTLHLKINQEEHKPQTQSKSYKSQDRTLSQHKTNVALLYQRSPIIRSHLVPINLSHPQKEVNEFHAWITQESNINTKK